MLSLALLLLVLIACVYFFVLVKRFAPTSSSTEEFLDVYRPYEDAYETPLINISPSEFGIYLINLDRSPQRLKKFQRYFATTDLFTVKSFQRIPAVDGKQIDVRQYVSHQTWLDIQEVQWNGYRTKHNQLTVGGVGCYLSHLKVYKALRESNYTYGLVFEDDVKFVHKDVYRRIRHAMMTIPNTWDILLLGCVCHVCNKYVDYQDLQHFFLLHAYIIKRSSAIKILQHIEHMPIRQQIDSELSTLAQGGKVKIVCLNKSIVVQDNSTNVTTIQTPMRLIKGVNPYDIPLD